MLGRHLNNQFFSFLKPFIAKMQYLMIWGGFWPILGKFSALLGEICIQKSESAVLSSVFWSPPEEQRGAAAPPLEDRHGRFEQGAHDPDRPLRSMHLDFRNLGNLFYVLRLKIWETINGFRL